MPPVRIDRCVCTGLSFAALLRAAQSSDWSLEQLQCHTGAGESCGMCRPYLREAMRTGQTVFHQLLIEDCDEDAA
jgi:bacterioferritin-associated ferredoxin